MSSTRETAGSAEPVSMTSSRPVRRFDWSNLGVRVASGLVLAPLAALAVWTGGWLFLLMLAIGSALLAHEWAGMTAPDAPKRFSIALLVAILPGVFLAHQGYAGYAWIYMGLAAVAFAAMAAVLRHKPTDALFGVLYLAAPIIALAWLRSSHSADVPNEGRGWTTLLFAVTWGADIGAYAVGSWLKGPKFAPQLSPSKTWSGAVGGLVAAMAAAVLVSQISSVQQGLIIAAAIGLIGGVATIGGDLFESMLKRRFGVKDSGDVIPGHGGFLDRVDGLMIAILAVAGMRYALMLVGNS